MGLGRVITLQLGLRADATRQLYGGTADLSNFCRDSIGGSPHAWSERSELRDDLRETLGRAQGYAAIAAISGLIPTIFITRVRL